MIKINVTENNVLAFALHETITEGYTESYGEIIPHLNDNLSNIGRLLNDPAGLFPLSVVVPNDATTYNIELWNDLLVEDGTTNWTALIEDVLYWLSDYKDMITITPEAGSRKGIIYTNAGKVLSLAYKYLDGETETPLHLLNERPDTEYYDFGWVQLDTYEGDKAKYETRSDDSDEYFKNIKYFEEGYIEPISECYKYYYNYNNVIYIRGKIIFSKIENDRYIDGITLNTDDIIEIILIKKETVEIKQCEYEACKYRITMKDGTRFEVGTRYMI